MTIVREVYRLRLRIALAVMFAAFAPCQGVLASASETAPASRPTTAPATQPAGRAPLLLPLSGAGETTLLDTMDDDPAPWGQMVAAVIVILVVGGVSLLIIKKFIPRLAVSTGKTISVVESIYLGPRLTVHLVDVAGQRFLLSSTRDRISMLAEVAPPAGEGVEGQGETSP